MSEPSISVTVPSYNRSASLAELLAAIVAQLHDGDELIVVDDASRDDSAQQARRFERCRVIVHETNQGMVKAWRLPARSLARVDLHHSQRRPHRSRGARRHSPRRTPRALRRSDRAQAHAGGNGGAGAGKCGRRGPTRF